MFKSNQEPDIPAALGLLSHLTNDELKELLNDDSKFEDIVKDVKQVIYIFFYNYFISIFIIYNLFIIKFYIMIHFFLFSF